MNRPDTTLFMIESVDGKISTGDVDELDVDKDFKRIAGVKEGLHQYYEIEKTTDRFSLGSGRVMAKVGVNTWKWNKKGKDDVNFIMIDNKPHLTASGCKYFAKRSPLFILMTTNKNHPAFSLQETFPNICILYYQDVIDFPDAFRKLKEDYGIKKMTIQTGGTLNAQLLRLGLIDRVKIVIAPCLIGGDHTQSLIGGESLHTQEDLQKIKALKLTKVEKLKNSYIEVIYSVQNETVITA